MKIIIYIILSNFLIFNALFASSINIQNISGLKQINSWKALRDKDIVKQDFDYSCGSASMATILNGFYGDSVTEMDLIKDINRKDASSFADLKRVVEKRGYQVLGLAANLNHLQTLKIPALLYLNYRGQDHFTVFRGMNDKVVLLSDPSWGNKKILISQFLNMWKTRDESHLYGKMLLIFSDKQANKAFFQPPTHSNTIYDSIMLNRVKANINLRFTRKR